MKRLHVHVSVDDLAQSTRFYSTLFAAEPTVVKDDYVKWMLEDPRVNFAISTRPGRTAGISHLGIQAEDEAELAEVYDRLARAERPIVEAKATTCCYAQSDKQWIADPQGVPWETFLTYGGIAEAAGDGELLCPGQLLLRGHGTRYAGETIRKDQLIARTWPDTVVDETVGWAKLLRVQREVGELADLAGEDPLQGAADRYLTLRKFAPPLLEALEFKAARAHDPTLSAIGHCATSTIRENAISPPTRRCPSEKIGSA
jgi:hypothetical protein